MKCYAMTCNAMTCNATTRNATTCNAMTSTGLGCRLGWKLRRVAGEAQNMMENALSILIVIFSIQLKQTETSDRKLCVFHHSSVTHLRSYTNSAITDIAENSTPASIHFSFYDQMYICDIFARGISHQSLCGEYLNLSSFPSISTAFETNAI